MPQVNLTFPQKSIPPTNASPGIPTPDVELQLSFSERTVDWFNYNFRNERAKAIGVHREMWLRGVQDEIVFWDEFLRTKGFEWQVEYAERFDPDLPLQNDFVDLITQPPGSKVRILDVGAGPFTWIGRKSPKWEIEIVPTDPLADAYDQLLLIHGVTPPVRTIQVPAEGLRKHFARESFDIATARNSLDHAINPVDAIQQMLETVRPGGTVLLMHNTHEATNNGWTGLHQWNFVVENGDFVIDSKVEHANVTSLLRGRATVSNWMPPEENWLNTIIRKHK